MQKIQDLQQENDELKEEIAHIKTVLQQKNHHIKALEELLANLKKRHFAPSSEQQPGPIQLGLFDEAEEVSEQPEVTQPTTTIVSHERRKQKRISIPETLPRIEVIHDLSDAEKNLSTRSN